MKIRKLSLVFVLSVAMLLCSVMPASLTAFALNESDIYFHYNGYYNDEIDDAYSNFKCRALDLYINDIDVDDEYGEGYFTGRVEIAPYDEDNIDSYDLYCTLNVTGTIDFEDGDITISGEEEAFIVDPYDYDANPVDDFVFYDLEGVIAPSGDIIGDDLGGDGLDFGFVMMLEPVVDEGQAGDGNSSSDDGSGASQDDGSDDGSNNGSAGSNTNGSGYGGFSGFFLNGGWKKLLLLLLLLLIIGAIIFLIIYLLSKRKKKPVYPPTTPPYYQGTQVQQKQDYGQVYQSGSDPNDTSSASYKPFDPFNPNF